MKRKKMSFIKLVFSLTVIAIEGRVNGMKIILSTQLELERVNAASMEKENFNRASMSPSLSRINTGRS